MKSFQQTQLALARYLRAPEKHPAPDQAEERRLHIYRDLIYNNIESFIANVFPVTRSILSDLDWHSLVRSFIESHYCQTPYFLQISDEFVHYLLQERGLRPGDPPYLLELAHYEWIELALDVSTQVIPDAGLLPKNMGESRPRVSPLAICLEYQYPVQKISSVQKEWLPELTRLVVYRNREDRVCFKIASALTARLLFLLQTQDQVLNTLLQQVIAEIQPHQEDALKKQAILLLEEFYQDSVISHFE